MQPRLLLTFKELADRQGKIFHILLVRIVDRLVLLRLDTVPDDRIHRGQICGHKCRCHLMILRIGLEDLAGGLSAELRELHILVVIGDRQPLVFRTAFRDLQHAADGVLRLVESERPESRDDLHAVVGPGHFHRLFAVAHRFADPCKELRGYSVHGIGIADAGPCSDRALNARKPDQVVLLNCREDRQEGLRSSAIRVLADRLAHALLQSCRQQEFREELVQLCAAGLHNAPDQRNCHDHRIVVAQDRFLRGFDHPAVSLIDARSNDIIKLHHVQIPGVAVVFLEVNKLLVNAFPGLCFFRQVFERCHTIDPQHFERLHESEGVERMRLRILRAHRRAKESPGILILRVLIQQGFVVCAVLLRHKDPDEGAALREHELLERLAGACRPCFAAALAQMLPGPLADHRKAAVHIIAKAAHLVKELLLLRRELFDLLFMLFVPTLQPRFLPFCP